MLGAAEKENKDRIISLSTIYDKLNDSLSEMEKEANERERYVLFKHQLEELKNKRLKSIEELKKTKEQILEYAGVEV